MESASRRHRRALLNYDGPTVRCSDGIKDNILRQGPPFGFCLVGIQGDGPYQTPVDGLTMTWTRNYDNIFFLPRMTDKSPA